MADFITFMLLMVVMFLWPSAVILRRVGYSAAWTLIMAVPLLNVVAVWMFAFRPWPIEREAEAYQGSKLPPNPPSL